MTKEPRRRPTEPAPPIKAPGDVPPRDAPGQPRRAPGHPNEPSSIEAPPAREPGPPPTDDSDNAESETSHEGATEEQIGNREGPGVGYDAERRR